MKKMNRLFSRCYPCVLSLILGAIGVSYISFSHAFESTPFSNTTKQLLMENDAEEIDLSEYQFLTVDEAYPLDVYIEDGNVIAEWAIADNYFLYGEQFRFSLKTDNNIIPLKTSDPVGIIEYDEIFEKDVEKHYGSVRITLDASQFDQHRSNILSITSQGCADAGLCYPPQTLEFTVYINEQIVTPLLSSNENALDTVVVTDASVTQTPWTLVLMILFALLGGVILNFMPCVFPILSIKALNIANNNAEGGSHKQHGWLYTLGIITTFTLLAVSLLIARYTGQALGWGFQLQSPGFVTALIYLFWVMGMSLSGHIHIGMQMMGVGQKLTQGNGLRHSFFTGVLAVVVASPCTAPFMATALGYALTQPSTVAVAIFIALGFGMALPLLLLCHLPQLEKRLPKPGPWMETLKQALAFPLYLTALWLLWVLGRQLNSDAISLVLLGGIVIIFAQWIKQDRHTLLSRVITIATIAFIAGIIWINHHKTTADTETVITETVDDQYWQSYSEEKLGELRRQGKPVFINVTADWCITCLANERLVLTDDTLSLMQDSGIHLMKADWTNYNPAITQLLQNYERNGIPLYLLFPAGADAKATILPQILTPAGFRNTIEKISAQQ